MEESFFRFPHIGEQILEQLDSKTLTKCREVNNLWREYIDNQKLPWTRMIKEFVEYSKQYLIQWNEFFNSTDFQSIKEIALSIINFKVIPNFPRKGSPLIYAVLSKNTEIVLKLLVKENDKYPTDEYLRTPLHHAAFGGNLRMCELIIKHFKDVSPKDKDQMTPLHIATILGEFDVCKLIIEKSKDGNSTTSPVLDEYENDDTAYEMALQKGSTKLCKLFLEDIKERDPEHEFNKHALHWTAYHGRLDLCRMLIAELDDKNPKKSDHGTTPLHMAAMYGHFNVCDLIIKSIKKSEEINPGDSSGDTPLHEACGNGYLDICKLIMTHTGQGNVINMLGETPLHNAVLGGHFLVCQWLTENNIEPNHKDVNGKTPYQYAVEGAHEDIIELLTPYSFPGSKRPRCK